MWQKQFQDAWRVGKRTVANMWNHAVKFAGDLDSGVRFTKRLFGALHPMLEDMGGGASASNARSLVTAQRTCRNIPVPVVMNAGT